MKKKSKKFNIPALVSAPAITALSAGIMGIGAIVKRKSVRGVKADYKTSVKRVVKTERCARSLTDDAMFAMIDTFERKMPYSGGHSRRVAVISRRIGEKIGIKDLDGLYYAALLHDVGKVYMSDKLLNKSKLSMTPEEREEWNAHPIAGAEFISSVPELKRYAGAVKHHHERYDGSGYPDAMAGDSIPIFSRIIGVADAYEAMSSERPGREAYPREYIMGEFNKCSGNQFDPKIVKAMMSVIADMTADEQR